jgi:hypothetical protein
MTSAIRLGDIETKSMMVGEWVRLGFQVIAGAEAGGCCDVMETVFVPQLYGASAARVSRNWEDTLIFQ